MKFKMCSMMMLRLATCIFFGCALSTVWAGIMHQCPQKNFKTDFNMTMYFGEWNEIYRIPNEMEVGYSCMMDNFTLSPVNVTRVYSHAYNATNQTYVILQGFAEVTEPGRFDILYRGDTQLRPVNENIGDYIVCPLKIFSEEISSRTPLDLAFSQWAIQLPYGTNIWSASYWILGTDYNRYAVLWGCLNELSGVIRPLSWIFSRDTTLDEDSMREVNEILQQNGLNLTQYEEVMQTDCPPPPIQETECF